MQNKKLLSVVLAAILLCACIVGMLSFGASATDTPINWTIASATDANADATFSTLQEAFDSIADNTTWENGRYLYIKIASTDSQTAGTDSNGILFGLETQFRQDGTRLPIVIEGGKLAPNFNSTNVACANSYTFKDLEFKFGTQEINFYAGSGQVEFSSVDFGTTNGASNCKANLYGDNFTAAAFAGWSAPADGELIETGLTFSGSFNYGAKGTSDERTINALTAGRICGIAYTAVNWEGYTQNDAVTPADTSVSLNFDGTWNDANQNDVVDSNECSIKIGSAMGRGKAAKAPVAELNFNLKNVETFGFVFGVRGESGAANVADCGNMDLNITVEGGRWGRRFQGIQYTRLTGDYTVSLDGGYFGGNQFRADGGSNTVTGTATLTVEGSPYFNNSSSTKHNLGISGVFSATVSNNHHLHCDLTTGTTQVFVAGRGASNGPVNNIVYSDAKIGVFYGLGGTTNLAQTFPVTNTVYEGALITDFYGSGTSTSGSIAGVTNNLYAAPTGTLSFAGTVALTNFTNNIYCSYTFPANYDPVSEDTGTSVSGNMTTKFEAKNGVHITVNGKFIGLNSTGENALSVTNILEAKEGGSITVVGAFYGTNVALSNSGKTALRNELKGVANISNGKIVANSDNASNVKLNSFYANYAGVEGNVENVFDGVKLGNTGSSAGCYGTAKAVSGSVTNTIIDTYINSRYYCSSGSVSGDITNKFAGGSVVVGRIWGSGGTSNTVSGSVSTTFEAFQGRIPTIPLFYGSYSKVNGSVINKFYAGDIGISYSMHYSSADVENYIYGGSFEEFYGYNGESNLVPASLTNNVYGGDIANFFGGARNNKTAASPIPAVTVVNNICKDPASTEPGDPDITIGAFYGGAHTNTAGYYYDITNNINGGTFETFYAGSADDEATDGEISTVIQGGNFVEFRGTGKSEVVGDPNRLNEDGYYAVNILVQGGNFNYGGDSSTRSTAFYGTEVAAHSVKVEVIESSRTSTAYADGAPFFNNSYFYATKGNVNGNVYVRVIGLGADDNGEPCYLRTHQLHTVYGNVSGDVTVELYNYNAGGGSKVIEGKVGGDVNIVLSNCYIESTLTVIASTAVGGNATVSMDNSIIKATSYITGGKTVGNLDVSVNGLSMKDKGAILYLGTTSASVIGDTDVSIINLDESVSYVGQLQSANRFSTTVDGGIIGSDFVAFSGIANEDVITTLYDVTILGDYYGAKGAVEGAVINNINGASVDGIYYGAAATCNGEVYNILNDCGLNTFYGGGKDAGTGAKIINSLNGALVCEFYGSSAMGTDASVETTVNSDSAIFGLARSKSEFAIVSGSATLSLSDEIYINSNADIVADKLENVNLIQVDGWSTGVVHLVAPIEFKDEITGSNLNSSVEGFAFIDASDGTNVKVIGFRTESQRILASLSLDERIVINLWLPKDAVDTYINLLGAPYEYKITMNVNGQPVVLGTGTISKTSNADASFVIDGILCDYYVVSLSGIGAGNFANDISFTGSGFNFTSTVLDIAKAGAQDYAGTDYESVFQAIYDYGAAANGLALKYDHLIGYTTEGIASPEIKLGSQKNLSSFRIDALMGDAVGLRLTANASGISSASQIALKQDGTILKQGRDYTVVLEGGKVYIELFFGADYMSEDYALTVTADGTEAITITTSVERVVAEIVKIDAKNDKATALLTYIQVIKNFKYN